MATQRELAEEGRDESTRAAKEAGSLTQRADTMAADARSLAEAATHSRSSVERASDVLLAIGDEVRITAESVHELSGMSERVGSFARTISRIARQTHVLALNAAIEAAHSEEGGEGFAAVADEVRALAAEAGGSARDVSDLIGDVLSRVDAVSKAMTSGEEKVRDVGAVAQQAQGALRDLERGISKIKELVDATATVSQTQAKRMATLADKMADVASISTGSANEADGAAAAMAAQQRTIGDLRAVSVQLAELAERVRLSIARFAVVDPADD
jgi:methyl-accepting chemotaxis protein